MRHLTMSLIAALVATAVMIGFTFAQPQPEFKLGFKELATVIPDVVGQPLEDQRHDPLTGDALQRTSSGLMAWRKLDNFTAFTNGSTTWVNGPFGVQNRPNNIRFDWEGPDRLPSLPEGAVTFTFSRDPGGAWVGQGTVRNPLGQAMDVEVNLAALSSSNGPPTMDAPTAFVAGLPPGESRSITVPVPTRADVGGWRWSVSSRPARLGATLFLDVGTSKGLNVDPLLAGSVEEMRKVDGGDWLARVAAENGVLVRRAATVPGVLGEFQADRNLVTISSLLDSSSAWVRAAVLAHELQHAAGAAADELPFTSLQCFSFEAQAFERQAVVWTAFWQADLPPEVDAIHAELNDVAFTVAHAPETFAAELIMRYRSECGIP